MSENERLSDKTAIRVALLDAIDYENSLIDAYNGNREEEGVQIAQRRVDAFKRVHKKYFGPLPGDRFKNAKTVNIYDLMKGKINDC